MAEKQPFLLDCDTGRDDALAIWCALQSRLPLAGIVASYGNVSIAQVAENTARTLSFAGRDDIPLWQGAERPSRSHVGFERIVLPRQKISGNGLCNVELPLSSRSQPISQKSPHDLANGIRVMAEKFGAIDYIVIGSMTSLAGILAALGDDTSHCIRHVTMMGGKFGDLWRDMPTADFNIVCDPFALHDVMRYGITLRFVPLNVTWGMCLPLEKITTLKEESDVARASKEIMTAYCQHFSPDGIFRFHDPLALLLAVMCDDFHPAKLSIDLDESSDSFGQLLDDENGFPCSILDPNPERDFYFLKRILETLGLQ